MWLTVLAPVLLAIEKWVNGLAYPDPIGRWVWSLGTAQCDRTDSGRAQVGSGQIRTQQGPLP